jgi:hypothetical protein
MKKTQTTLTKRFLLDAPLIVGVLVGLSGCITAAAIATVAYVKSQSEYTAVVLLDVSPDKVYAAMKKVAATTKDLEIKKEDPGKFTMAVQKNKNTATASAKRLDSGKTEFKVTASAREEQVSHEELALRVVERVCKELGVRYQVEEKKSPF